MLKSISKFLSSVPCNIICHLSSHPFIGWLTFCAFLEAWSHVKSMLNQQWWLWNQIDNLFKFKQLFPSDNCFVFVWLQQPLENCLKQVNFRYQIQIIVNTLYAQSLLHVLFVCNNAKHSWFFYKMKFFFWHTSQCFTHSIIVKWSYTMCRVLSLWCIDSSIPGSQALIY